MSLINIDKLNFDGTFIQSILDLAKKFITGQPVWLRALAISAIIIGGSYFIYNHFINVKDVQELQEEIIVIEEKMDGILSTEMYQENLIYVITEIQLLQQEENQSYKDELLEIELSIDYIKRYHPEDPAIADLEAMKSRLTVNHETYQQHYDHVMRMLKKTANDTIH